MGKVMGVGDHPLPTLYRCVDCDKLLGEEMLSEGICVGHKLKYATKGTVWEWIKVKLKVIR